MKKLVAFAVLGLCISAPVAADAGQAVYVQRCAQCHDTGLLNSLKLGDKMGWAPRVATGLDAMTAVVKKGKGAMPPRGACGLCSDADLRAAVEYIASKSR